MRRIRKFLYIFSTQQYLLVKSVLLLGAIRVGLWLLPFRILRRLVARATQGSPMLHEADRVSVDRVVRTVNVASRYVPDATCLARALATKILLCRRGQPANLRIGVTHNEAGKFEAHAWVESHDRVVIGGPESLLRRYTPLPAWDEEII